MDVHAAFQDNKADFEALGIASNDLFQSRHQILHLLQQKVAPFMAALAFKDPTPQLVTTLTTAIELSCPDLVLQLLQAANGAEDSIDDAALFNLYTSTLTYKEHWSPSRPKPTANRVADMTKALTLGTKGRKKHYSLEIAVALGDRELFQWHFDSFGVWLMSDLILGINRAVISEKEPFLVYPLKVPGGQASWQEGQLLPALETALGKSLTEYATLILEAVPIWQLDRIRALVSYCSESRKMQQLLLTVGTRGWNPMAFADLLEVYAADCQVPLGRFLLACSFAWKPQQLLPALAAATAAALTADSISIIHMLLLASKEWQKQHLVPILATCNSPGVLKLLLKVRTVDDRWLGEDIADILLSAVWDSKRDLVQLLLMFVGPGGWRDHRLAEALLAAAANAAEAVSAVAAAAAATFTSAAAAAVGRAQAPDGKQGTAVGCLDAVLNVLPCWSEQTLASAAALCLGSYSLMLKVVAKGVGVWTQQQLAPMVEEALSNNSEDVASLLLGGAGVEQWDAVLLEGALQKAVKGGNIGRVTMLLDAVTGRGYSKQGLKAWPAEMMGRVMKAAKCVNSPGKRRILIGMLEAAAGQKKQTQ